MNVIASIHIQHLLFNIHYHTEEGEFENASDALEHFYKLANRISAMEKDNETFVIDASEGRVMLNKKFLTDSVLRLSIFERE